MPGCDAEWGVEVGGVWDSKGDVRKRVGGGVSCATERA